ncbi:carbonic anhydrase [SAR116 cluster alpha proteobacterium HIMB100]|nr:carbonic anhydrase [SAR116 cluster alpha proteobacterium HIMB100]
MIDALTNGFNGFRSRYFEESKQLFEHLTTHGQAPKVMMISCADSRVDPAMMFNASPGDLFVIRNVANLVPPYRDDTDDHSVSSALEFGVKDLKVEHIIVMGHALCGGMKALCSYCQQTEEEQAAETEENRRSFIRGWVDVARPAIDQVDMNQPEPDKFRDAEQASVANSLKNLRSFSFIKDKEAAGELALHGWWFDMNNGSLWAFDSKEGKFISLVPARTEQG